jgi:two-component system LytT family sensor kinase
MEIVKAYLFLQNARFEGGFFFISELGEDVLKTLIPPFTLQLLIENCLKHNVVSIDRPLSIKLYSEDSQIIVSNVIRLKTGENNSLGVGLKNIQLRYDHLLERGIEIINDGKLFQIKLPIIYEHHHR